MLMYITVKCIPQGHVCRFIFIGPVGAYNVQLGVGCGQRHLTHHPCWTILDAKLILLKIN